MKEIEAIEPRILPLVEALNQTGIVQTFSSCEGHYEPHEQTLADRNLAFVRFVPAPGMAIEQVEMWLTEVLAMFKDRHGLLPMHLLGYQAYTPIGEGQTERTFVLELRPFSRFEPPDTKRTDTDRAIGQVVRLVREGLPRVAPG